MRICEESDYSISIRDFISVDVDLREKGSNIKIYAYTNEFGDLWEYSYIPADDTDESVIQVNAKMIANELLEKGYCKISDLGFEFDDCYPLD